MKNFIKVLFYVIASVTIVNAWEINTHRAIDRCAISSECGGQRSLNLNQFVKDVQIENDDYKDEIFESYTTRSGGKVTYFDYATSGEKYGISKWNQTFDSHTYSDLIEAGTILEDSLWPKINQYILGSIDPDGGRGRFGNHFYDPQDGGAGLSIVPGFANTDAITWAFEDGTNNYSFKNAIESFQAGFSAQSEKERLSARARMFVSLGFMLHLLNDMNVPAHTRDDSHPLGDPLEEWMRGGEKGSDKGGFRIDRYDLSGKNDGNIKIIVNSSTAFRYNSFKDFYKSEGNYTGTHFYSEDSISVNGGTFSGYSNYHPTKDEVDSYKGDDVGYITSHELASHKKLAMMRKSKIWKDGLVTTLLKPYFYSMQYGDDTTVLEDNGIHLIPHAVANAEGFVNYFFRGRIKGEFTGCELKISNISEPSLVANSDAITFKSGGKFDLYLDDNDGIRRHLVSKVLDSNLAVNKEVSIPNVSSAIKNVLGAIPEEPVKVIVVYSGSIGSDAGVAVTYVDIKYDASLIPQPIRGKINVQLTWDNPEIDMNLAVDMPFGEQDIKDVCLPIEHYVVQSEVTVDEGIYKVFVRNSTGADESQLPQMVHLAIDVPGEAVTFDFNITSSDVLDLGHVADIVISKDEVVLQPVVHTGTGNPPKVTHYSSNSGADYSSYSSYVQQYTYDIISKLKQALLGPLSDAEVTIYDAFDMDTPLYTTQTTGGISPLTTGIMYFPKDILNTLDDSKYYIVSIVGGDDIDANDDGYLDTNTTTNNGTIRAIIKGDRLKNDNFKVNILSEIIYQLTEEILINQADTTTIKEKIEDITHRLLLSDIDGNNMIEYDDILSWIPMHDKDKLQKEYNSNFEPVVQKIYSDEDIYDDAYAIAYDTYLNNQTLHITENSPEGTIVGTVHIGLYDANATFSISGDKSEDFSIDDSGVVKVANGAVLDYENKNSYSLNLSAIIGTKTLSSTLTINIDNELDAPELGGFASYIDENSPQGTYVGQLYVNQGASSIIELKLQGNGAENFSVDAQGTITVNPTAILDYESKRVYHIQAVAINNEGQSLPASIYIYLNNLPDTPPTLQPLLTSIDENSPIGTLVGTININNNGNEITSISLSGIGSENFSVGVDGVITVANDVLDYESKSNYTLQAVAGNAFGLSEAKNITINLTDLPDSPPIVQPLNIVIQKNTLEGIIIGVLNIDDDGSDILDLTLSGEDSEYFNVDLNGTIKLAKDLNNVTKQNYNLQVTATNAYGKSQSVSIKMVIMKLTLIGNYNPLNSANSITLSQDGTFAFVAGGTSGVTIFNVSNPASPLLVGRYDTSGIANSVTLSHDGTLAFVADRSSGVQILDVSNPASPLLVGSYNTSGDAQSITLSQDGTLAFVADSYSGVQILDVSNPTSPLLVGHYDTSGYALNVTLSQDGTLAFVADNSSGVQILDVSDPDSPLLIGSYDTSGYARSITLSQDGTLAFVADNSSGVQILDVSDPDSPLLIGSYDTSGSAYNVTLSQDGTLAFVADRSSGVIIFNVSNPASPLLVGRYDTSSYAENITLSQDGTLAFVAGGSSGVTIFNVSNPASPLLVGRYDTSGDAQSITLSQDGTLAFVTGSESDVKIFDVSNPASPLLVGSYDTSGSAYNVTLSHDGTLAFVANYERGVQILDVSNPASPLLVGSYNTSGYVENVTLSQDGALAFVADSYSGVKILDISNPASPLLVGSYNTSGYVENVTLSQDGTLVFVADGDSGLQILDVSNPASPLLVGSYDTSSYTKKVTLSQDETLAFIADWANGLQILDVSNPASPLFVGSYDTSGIANSVTLSQNGTLVFVANGSSGIQILDVSNPASPLLVESYDTSDLAYSVTLSQDGTLVFVADGDSGLQILSISSFDD